MSKKSKVKPRAERADTYLNPEFAEIQDALYSSSQAASTSKRKKKGQSMNEHGWEGGTGFGGSGWIGGGVYGGMGSGSVCDHTGSKVVYECEGKQLFASSWRGLDEYSDQWELIIDLANNVTPKYTPPPFIRSLSAKRFSSLEAFAVKHSPKQMTAELLALEWPDMSAPRATLSFWLQLWDMLPPKTVIACMGGHGRTGTALAALMIATGIDYYEAVERVHKDHCKKAIETMDQERYLHGIYIDFLRFKIDQLKDIPDVGARQSLQLELAYALEHPPVAEIVKPKKHSGGMSSTGYGYGYSVDIPGTLHTALPLLAHEEKMSACLISGKPYVKQCIDPACHDVQCTKGEHMGWMPDFAQMAAKGLLTPEETLLFVDEGTIQDGVIWE